MKTGIPGISHTLRLTAGIVCIGAACLFCLLGANAEDLDRKLWIQNVLVNLERQRDEALARMQTADAMVARHKDLVKRTAGGTREAQATAREALATSLSVLEKRRSSLLRAEERVGRVRNLLAKMEGRDLPVQALILKVEGDVSVIGKDGRKRRLGIERSWLEPEDLIQTLEGQRVELKLMEGEATAVIGPGSLVRISDVESREVLGLQKGSAALSLRRELQREAVKLRTKNRMQIEIRTPAAVSSVRGTRVVATVEPDGSTRFLVLEGTVDVSGNSEKDSQFTRPVTAGQRIRIPGNHAPGTPLPEPEAVDLTTLDRWWEDEK